MCKLADTSVYELDLDAVNKDLLEVDSIISTANKSRPPNAVSQDFTTHKVRWEWKKDNDYADSPKDCVLKKLLSGIRKTMVPMNSDNPGIMLIDSMIDGKTTEYQQTYVGEHND